MKKIMIAVLALSVLCMFTGVAMAAYLPNETPETQTITTITSVKCLGTVFESESVTISDTNQAGPGEPPLANKEVQSLSSYSTSLLAGNGYTEYDKSVEVDTSNMAANEYNIETATVLEYSGNGAVFDESILEEGASTGDSNKGKTVLCPFGNNEPAAAFCNRAMATTNFMGDNLDLISTANSRSIAKTYDVGAALDYGVTANGVGAITVTFDSVDIDSRTAQTTDKKLVPSVFVPGDVAYTPSSYTPEYWTIGKCIPKLVPSEYTPESVIVTPGVYIPEHHVIIGKNAEPSASMEYHERTTAIGAFDVTKLISYKSQL